MTGLLAWLANTMLGPLCPHGCGYRARGERTLAAHETWCPFFTDTTADESWRTIAGDLIHHVRTAVTKWGPR